MPVLGLAFQASFTICVPLGGDGVTDGLGVGVPDGLGVGVGVNVGVGVGVGVLVGVGVGVGVAVGVAVGEGDAATTLQLTTNGALAVPVAAVPVQATAEKDLAPTTPGVQA